MSTEKPDNTPENLSMKTYYAPPERADPADIKQLTSSVLEFPIFPRTLDAMPCPAVVLNKERQIVYANSRMLEAVKAKDPEDLIGKRPGEVVGCIHAEEGPAGCGTSEACAMCGAVNAILECQRTGKMITKECQISVETGQTSALDFEVVASSFNLDAGPITVCALRDISAEKRKQVLERVFFHDVLNTAGGLQGLSQILLEDHGDLFGDAKETLTILATLSEVLIQEIREHRQLFLAETGELHAYPGGVSPQGILTEVQTLLANHEAARGRIMEVQTTPDVDLETDPDLLRRVLVNMAKNALEATPPGGTVTLSFEELGERIAFHVHNTTVMPEEVRLQVFNRSFSTKPGQGHGIGTYSMKLLGERYLGGKVYFTSDDTKGTTFTLEVPKEWGV